MRYFLQNNRGHGYMAKFSHVSSNALADGINSSSLAVGYFATCSSFSAKRHFSVMKSGHDRVERSLFDLIGFGNDTEAELIQRTTADLKNGLISEAMKLKSPETNPEERKKLDEMTRAYTLLQDENFRKNYTSHHYNSNDVQLHVLVDGGKISANLNPEHQSFVYLDATGAEARGSSADGDSELPIYSLGDFTEAFKTATGTRNGAKDAKAYSATDAKSALSGSDIHFQLKLAFEEALLGCVKRVQYKKEVQCKLCEGNGSQKLKTLRKCPQCAGRGCAILPSGTYHIERRCTYCSGEGTVPPPPCRSCGGEGTSVRAVVVPVTVPPGMISGAVFRVPKKGNDGVRGGRSGDLVLTVVVAEHRHFHRDGDKMHAMLPIPLSVALLGGLVNVPTLTGERAQLRVPPCVRNGQILPFSQYSSMSNLMNNSSTEEKTNENTSENIFFHALIIIPHERTLTGKQKSALTVYGQHFQTLSGEMRETEENNQETFAASSSTDHKTTDAELYQQCADLKNQYKHWFKA